MAATLSYDRHENIVFIGFAEPTQLRTRDEITEHFAHVTQFWRAQTGGKKAYFVADISNVTINMAELEFYSRATDKAQRECALASVRYGDNPLQRTLTRLGSIKIQRSSNLHATRDEAVAAVRALRDGELGRAATRRP